MNLLFDTHTFIWFIEAPDRIKPHLQNTLSDPMNKLWLSTASVWEMQIKMAIRKLSLSASVEEFVTVNRAVNDVQSLPVLEQHIWSLANLPLHHNDPFDRLLIAQALAEGYTLVTADPFFTQYPVALLK